MGGIDRVTRLIKAKRCPTCGGDDFTRRHRTPWMRLFRRSQFFVCRQCRTPLLLLHKPGVSECDLASD
jgi:hypothetical protein